MCVAGKVKRAKTSGREPWEFGCGCKWCVKCTQRDADSSKDRAVSEKSQTQNAIHSTMMM